MSDLVLSQSLSILDLILSYILNFPIISESGFHSGRIMALVVENEIELRKLINAYQEYAIKVTVSASDEAIARAFKFSTSRAVVFTVPPKIKLGKRELQLITKFWDILQHSLCGNSNFGTPILFCVGRVPEDIKELTLEVHITKNDFLRMPGAIEDFLPEYKDFGYIEQTMRDYVDATYPELFYAAIMTCVASQKNHGANHVHLSSHNLDVVNEITRVDHQFKEQSIDMWRPFILVLDHWFDMNSDKVCVLPYLNDDDIRNMDSRIFVDEIHVYIRYSLFSRIIETMKRIVRVGALNECLKIEGIVLPGSDAITSRMPFYDSNGNFRDVRMLRLSKDALVSHGFRGDFYG